MHGHAPVCESKHRGLSSPCRGPEGAPSDGDSPQRQRGPQGTGGGSQLKDQAAGQTPLTVAHKVIVRREDGGSAAPPRARIDGGHRSIKLSQRHRHVAALVERQVWHGRSGRVHPHKLQGQHCRRRRPNGIRRDDSTDAATPRRRRQRPGILGQRGTA